LGCSVAGLIGTTETAANPNGLSGTYNGSHLSQTKVFVNNEPEPILMVEKTTQLAMFCYHYDVR